MGVSLRWPNDALVDAELDQELAAWLPARQRMRSRRVGHNVQKTHAEELARALLAWVSPQSYLGYTFPR